MTRFILTHFILFITILAYCQPREASRKLNLDFDNTGNGTPTNWNSFGSLNYVLAVDSTTVKSGRYSAPIEFKEGDPEFKAWAFTLPNNYAGKKITLTGYIKTENVREGYAGLWMRIDPSIAFDNMNNNGVKGTTDWTKYQVTLTMSPEKTEQIVVGALLVGKGKMWLDELSVTIDGKDINDLKPYIRTLSLAEKDNEFANGSKITSISVDRNKTEDLKALGLIWGFLKYYHPNIAKGEYNWDYELFRILPRILHSETKKARDDIFV